MLWQILKWPDISTIYACSFFGRFITGGNKIWVLGFNGEKRSLTQFRGGDQWPLPVAAVTIVDRVLSDWSLFGRAGCFLQLPSLSLIGCSRKNCLYIKVGVEAAASTSLTEASGCELESCPRPTKHLSSVGPAPLQMTFRSGPAEHFL